MTEKEAQAYDSIITQYARTLRFGWWELGEAARIIKEKHLWRQFAAPAGEEAFHSWDDYVHRRGQKSRTAIYRALRLRTILKDIPEDTCRAITQANAIWLQRLIARLGAKSKAIKPETMAQIVANAQSMQEEEFAEYCNKKLPGAAKEETKEPISFGSCDRSLAKVVNQAIKVALWEISLEGDAVYDDRRDALERLCVFYLDSTCEHEGFKGLSNREAFQVGKGKGNKAKKVKAGK
jgi:hypothetical protein